MASGVEGGGEVQLVVLKNRKLTRIDSATGRSKQIWPVIKTNYRKR